MPPTTAKLTGNAPVLLVKDVVAAANHYRDAMGFAYDRFFGEPPGFVILYRDDHYLMLKQVEDPEVILPHWKVTESMWNVYFWVDNADALYEEFVARGAKIDYGLGNKDYGCREFGTQDLDGYDIGFGQILDATR